MSYSQSEELKTNVLINKEDLHPTSHEFLNQLSEDTEYDFLQRFKPIRHDITALKTTAYHNNTTIEQTILCFLRICEINPMDIESRLPIILYLQNKQQYTNAHTHSLYAIQNFPSHTTDLALVKIKMLYACHIENLYHLTLYNQVIECAKELSTKYGHIPIVSSRIYHIVFFANTKLKQWKEAVVNITKSIVLDPGNPTLYNDRCFVYCKQHKFDKALQDAYSCIQFQPDHESGLINRGSVYNSLEKYELAIIDLDKAIEISNGKCANAFKHRAFAYYKLKSYDKAIGDINQALIVNREYEDAMELKLLIWNDHLTCIRDGIDVYCGVYGMHFGTPLVYVVTDYVVGTIVNNVNPVNDATK